MQPAEKIWQDIRASNQCGDHEASKAPQPNTAIMLSARRLRDDLVHW
jgi:hypothetical protein